jgi:hypothetical protein
VQQLLYLGGALAGSDTEAQADLHIRRTHSNTATGNVFDCMRWTLYNSVKETILFRGTELLELSRVSEESILAQRGLSPEEGPNRFAVRA